MMLLQFIRKICFKLLPQNLETRHTAEPKSSQTGWRQGHMKLDVYLHKCFKQFPNVRKMEMSKT